MDHYHRRGFLRRVGRFGVSSAGLALLAGCSRLAPSGAPSLAASATIAAREGAPETTTIRFAMNDAACFAPTFVAEGLLRAQGFTEVQYVNVTTPTPPAVIAGEADMAMVTTGLPVILADTDNSLVTLAGVHVGCFELFAGPTIHSITDLRDKRVAVTNPGSGRHVHLAAMAAYVGLDPNREIAWITDPAPVALRRFAAGEIDALMAFPPEPQELRAKGIGHVIVSTAKDRPWSQYFCCSLFANRAFVQRHPVATKRALRAVLQATDICASEPERAARAVVERGVTDDFSVALEAVEDVPYGLWRDYDPEDTFRFYALRFREIGMIKSTPDEIIQRGTDWRFLNELKHELKA